MKRSLSACGLLVAALHFSAPASEDTHDEARPPVVSGLVRHGGGEPVPYVSVSLKGRDLEGRSFKLEVLTDWQGVYRFEGVYEGEYKLRARRKGFRFTPNTIRDLHSGEEILEDFVADPGSGPAPVTGFHAIRGSVRDDHGNPVPGVEVTLRSKLTRSDDKIKLRVVTNSYGEYVFENLLPSAYDEYYDVRCRAPSLERYHHVRIENRDVDELDFTLPTQGAAAGLQYSPALAFPGAEGFGRSASGGRGGDVYAVTNTQDSGAGSLRDALETADGPRTIVFRTSGTIPLQGNLEITGKHGITIAGQTAPGGGITLRGAGLVIQDSSDVVVRYLRSRPGDIRYPTFEDDAFRIMNSSDVILDHVSASWNVDETVSVIDSDRTTVQWSVLSEGLLDDARDQDGFFTGKATLLTGSGGLSFHHNLLVHQNQRSPRVGGTLQLDFVNNVVFNWGSFSGRNGGVNDGVRLNHVKNYLVAGPATLSTKRNWAFEGFGDGASIYHDHNLIDSDLDGRLDGRETGDAMFAGDWIRQSNRFPMPAVPTDSAEVAYDRVLLSAGASRSRDTVDQRVIQEVHNQNGGMLRSQSDIGGWPTLATASAPLDSDGDGMPNSWENALSYLNAQDPSDRNDVRDSSGYTNLEVYLNFLVSTERPEDQPDLEDLPPGHIDQDPAMEVRGNGAVIANGDLSPDAGDGTDFGLLHVDNAVLTRTFTLRNTGEAALSLSGNPRVSIGGPHRADFNVTRMPRTPVEPGGQTMFDIQYNPRLHAATLRDASVVITNNDPDRPTYSFAIQGSARVPVPEVEVRGTNEQVIPAGDTSPSSADGTDFGSVDPGSSSSEHTFRVYNVGDTTLRIFRIRLEGSHPQDFSLSAASASELPAGRSLVLRVTFRPGVSGTRRATVMVETNDSDEDFYAFQIQGVGSNRVPEIEVRSSVLGQPDLVIANNDLSASTVDGTDLGALPIIDSPNLANGGAVRTSFKVYNVGVAPLELGSVTVTGAHASDFSFGALPAATVAPGAWVRITLTFTPGGEGVRVGTVTILSNDLDEDPYRFRVQGEGIVVPLVPQIDVRGLGISIQNRDATPSLSDGTDYGPVPFRASSRSGFRIYNTGTANLVIQLPSIGGFQSGDFSITDPVDSTVIGPGANELFTVTMVPRDLGLRSTAIRIMSNDPANGDFTFMIQGTGVNP